MSVQIKGYVPLDGIFPLCHCSTMSETIIDRIMARVLETNSNATDVSRRAGLNPGYLRDLSRKGNDPTVTNLGKIAGVLGVSAEYLQTGKTEDLVHRQAELPVEGTPVVGKIAAGQFKDISILSQDHDYPAIPAPQNTWFPRLKQYALEVEGDSMNKVVLEGTFVICVPFHDTRLSLRSEMIVHVERSIAGTHLVETTLKEVEVRDDGTIWLMPRSSNSKHQPIAVDGDESTLIEIRGLVTSLWKPMRRPW